MKSIMRHSTSAGAILLLLASNFFYASVSFQTVSIKSRSGLITQKSTIQIDDVPAIMDTPVKQKAVMFKNLEGSTFQHPLDKVTTARLSGVPFVERITRRILGFAEQAAQLENLSSSVLVGPKQMSSIYQLLHDACKILDMEEPEVYIKQNPTPNAYTLAIRGRKPFIVLHSSIVELLTAEGNGLSCFY
jgi:Zn-dependent protease with chaperone function